MHFNIKYNLEGYFKKSYGKNDPNSVFKTGLAVCEGFSGLY